MVRFLLRITFIILIPASVALATFAYLHRAFFRPLDAADSNPVIVDIQAGKSFVDISRMLEERRVLRHSWALRLLARLRRVDTKINAGEYELAPSMTPKELLAKLMSGEVVKRQVTLREGETIWDLGPALEKAGIIAAEEFNRALTDTILLSKAGIEGPSFEGYLYPNTYNFSKNTRPDQIIWKMLEEGEKHWPPEFSARADELRMSRHELLTLASIIEKETGKPEERPIVSSVFHNRLAQGMKLQADPTVIYGISHFDGNLTKENLQTPTPYNTYIRFGLPPGPIANPSESSIRAALYPKQTTYLFFVSDGNGQHVFASTLQEHNANVSRLQRPAASS